VEDILEIAAKVILMGSQMEMNTILSEIGVKAIIMT
jgi:hypothetical protein